MQSIARGLWLKSSRRMTTLLIAAAVAVASSLLPNLVNAQDAENEVSAITDTAQQFVTAIDTANGGALNKLIDTEALSTRVLRSIELNAVDRLTYTTILGAQYGMLGYSVAGQMAQQKAKAKLVRNAQTQAGGDFLVRLDTQDANGNQAHGFLQVELGSDGRIVDWMDHALAQSMSQQLAFSAINILTTAQVAQMLLGVESEAIQSAALMNRFAAALQTGDMQQANAALLEMPESIQKRKEFGTIRVVMARRIGMEAYTEALADLARRHGSADDLQFVLIDHYILSGEHELALRAINNAARLIIEDPVMDANRCHVLLELGRKADALAACDRAIASEAKLETPRWTRVRLGLRTEDAPLTIESLTAIEQMNGKPLDPARLAANKTYAWLVKQPEFIAWGAERGWSPPAN